MFNYQKKYLKYKEKYLNKKNNLIGGSTYTFRINSLGGSTKVLNYKDTESNSLIQDLLVKIESIIENESDMFAVYYGTEKLDKTKKISEIFPTVGIYELTLYKYNLPLEILPINDYVEYINSAPTYNTKYIQKLFKIIRDNYDDDTIYNMLSSITNPNFILYLLELGYNINLSYLSNDLKNNKDIILTFIKKDVNNFKYISFKFVNNSPEDYKKIILDAVKINVQIFSYLNFVHGSPEYYKNILLAAMEIDNSVIKYIDPVFIFIRPKYYKEIILDAVTIYPKIVSYVNYEYIMRNLGFKYYKDLIISAIDINYDVLSHIDFDLFNSKYFHDYIQIISFAIDKYGIDKLSKDYPKHAEEYQKNMIFYS